MLLPASCGQQHDAESIVEDFMNEQLLDAKGLKDVEFQKLDSTRIVNDSVIKHLRNRFKENTRYRKNLVFGNPEQGRMLKYIRVNYTLNGDSCSDTYYLNAAITHVVAIKNNN